MNRIVLHDAFVPQGCADQIAPLPAVEIGAGAIWLHVYEAVTGEAGRFVRGGGCTTVRVAGLIQSGGFGNFSKNFGTAAGSLLEAEIVTADGQVRVANACRDPDLFSGIKGGGGGTFGVVAKLVLKTYELPEAFGSAQLTVKAVSDEAFRRLIGQFLDFYRDQLLNPHWEGVFQLRHDNTLAVSMISQGLDPTRPAQHGIRFWNGQPQGRTSWWPAGFGGRSSTGSPRRPRITTWRHRRRSPACRRATFGTQTSIELMRQPRSLPTIVPGRCGGITGGSATARTMVPSGMGFSRTWLSASLLEADQAEQLADALFAASRSWSIELQPSKGLAGAPTEALAAARDTATNPAVLDAFALAIVGGTGPPAYPEIAGHAPDLARARRDANAIARATGDYASWCQTPGHTCRRATSSRKTGSTHSGATTIRAC